MESKYKIGEEGNELFNKDEVKSVEWKEQNSDEVEKARQALLNIRGDKTELYTFGNGEKKVTKGDGSVESSLNQVKEKTELQLQQEGVSDREWVLDRGSKTSPDVWGKSGLDVESTKKVERALSDQTEEELKNKKQKYQELMFKKKREEEEQKKSIYSKIKSLFDKNG